MTSVRRILLVSLLGLANNRIPETHGQSLKQEPDREGRLLDKGPSIVVRSYPGGPIASEVLREAATLRRDATERWCSGLSVEPWRPRCEIVLHATRSRYLRSVGSAGGQTTGSSLIDSSDGAILRRRVDLLVDGEGRCPALKHELTHVVLADWFRGSQPPPWADEGIATLADGAEKQALHRRDCRQALADGSAMHMVELVQLEQLSSREQAAAFYGQSLSLVAFLAERAEPNRLLPFVDLAESSGYDHALREVYAINGMGDLQGQWVRHELAKSDNLTHQVLQSR